MSIDAARDVIAAAIARRRVPRVRRSRSAAERPALVRQLGALAFDADAPPVIHDTIYDLASLTKPIATATIAMDLVRRDALQLDARVGAFFDDWRGADREEVTIRDLLEHASGLPARLVDPPPDQPGIRARDLRDPLEYAPRTRSIYSDLGFILLGIARGATGGAPLDALFERITRIGTVHLEAADTPGIYRTVSESPFDFAIDDVLAFGVAPDARPWTAPTEPMNEDPRHGRRLVGEVHDNYAAALGGVAGHAGYSATRRRRRFRAARAARPRAATRRPPPFSPSSSFTRSAVPGSSRALGWDTMLPTSSCGERMSASAFGHVGFTGTSLWLDPDRDRYFVLLTNRVGGGGTLDDMRAVRRAFHDALADV